MMNQRHYVRSPISVALAQVDASIIALKRKRRQQVNEPEQATGEIAFFERCKTFLGAFEPHMKSLFESSLLTNYANIAYEFESSRQEVRIVLSESHFQQTADQIAVLLGIQLAPTALDPHTALICRSGTWQELTVIVVKKAR